MADKFVKTAKEYAVGSGAGVVKLALTIGEGQFGTSRVRLAGTEIGTASGPMSVTVGKRDEIKSKELFIRSVVNDVNSATNRMSVTYRLSGGTKAQKTVVPGKVEKDNDLLVFETRVALT